MPSLHHQLKVELNVETIMTNLFFQKPSNKQQSSSTFKNNAIQAYKQALQFYNFITPKREWLYQKLK
jgi:hypothetical protein